MSLKRLRGCLEQCEGALRTRQMAVRPITTVGMLEARGDELASWGEYRTDQERCLDALDKIAAGMEAGSMPKGIALLLAGSLARLEYTPGASDFDSLAVSQTRRRPPTRRDHRNLKRIEARLDGLVQDHFGALEDDLDVTRPGPISAEVQGMPFQWRRFGVIPRNSTCAYSEAELFSHIGAAAEAAWAHSSRGGMLFGTAHLAGDPEVSDDFRRTARNKCKVWPDFRKSAFPLLCYASVLALMMSGVIGKVGHVRNLATGDEEDEPPHERIKRKCAFQRALMWLEAHLPGALERPKPPPEGAGDDLHAKVVQLRLWGPQINLLTLHFVYWKSVTALEGEQQKEREQQKRFITKLLCAPTIHKLMLALPTWAYGKGVDDDGLLERLRKQLERYRDDAKIKAEQCGRAKNALQFVWNHIVSSGVSENKTLAEMYRSVWAACTAVRKQKGRFGLGELGQIHQDLRTLNHILAEAAYVSRVLHDAEFDPDSTDPYPRMFRVVSECVFSEAWALSEALGPDALS